MPDIDKEKTCCFFGHRKIDETAELKNRLYEIIENLIVNENVDTFLFGSKSEFDDLCHKIVTNLKVAPQLLMITPLRRKNILLTH